MTTPTTTSIVNTVEEVQRLVDQLVGLPTNPPSLYIDLEGVHLGRHGTVSILQLFVPNLNQVFLIDIHILKESAFSASSTNGSLKSILQSASIPKVTYDIRNDSDALYHHYGIEMAGVQDLQLMEYATRNSYRKTFLKGLAKCIENDASLTPTQKEAWKKTKDEGKKTFDPQLGGSYETFNMRPMAPGILEYCIQDVLFLPGLWEIYNLKLGKNLREKVGKATLARIKDSQSAGYQGHGKHMALGPW